MRLLLLSLALAALLPAARAAAQEQGFPWHLYTPNTLAAVAREHEADATKYPDKGQLVFTAGRPYRVVLVYTGKSRPVPAERKELLKLWAGTYGVGERVVELFEHEYLFKEGGAEHWLPVQGPVTKHFPKELSEGEEVEIYTQFVGGKRDEDSGRPDWLFLVNEFQKLKNEGP